MNAADRWLPSCGPASKHHESLREPYYLFGQSWSPHRAALVTEVVVWGSRIQPSPRGSVKTKDAVRDLLDRLPDDCTLEDVLYHLYVVQAIERGLADAEAGRTISHEQVAEELRQKWVLGAAG